MTEFPAAAQRLRPPGWKDPRLIVGIILVTISIAGVVGLVRSADARQGYWAASVDVVPGVKVQASDFHIVQANISESAENYWLATEELPAEFFVASTILHGELLAARQVATADPDRRQQTGIRVSGDLPRSVTIGSRVDVWVALQQDNARGFDEPTRMITHAEVVGIADQSSAFASTNTTTVYLMLAQDVVPKVLSAQANDANIALLPSTGGA